MAIAVAGLVALASRAKCEGLDNFSHTGRKTNLFAYNITIESPDAIRKTLNGSAIV